MAIPDIRPHLEAIGMEGVLTTQRRQILSVGLKRQETYQALGTVCEIVVCIRFIIGDITVVCTQLLSGLHIVR